MTTLHPDEQTRELAAHWLAENFFVGHRDDCKGCIRFIDSLTALLARVRLAEAEWWAGINPPKRPHAPASLMIEERQRIASLRQAAGEGK